jgi:hypothetical protein
MKQGRGRTATVFHLNHRTQGTRSGVSA